MPIKSLNSLAQKLTIYSSFSQWAESRKSFCRYSDVMYRCQYQVMLIIWMGSNHYLVMVYSLNNEFLTMLWLVVASLKIQYKLMLQGAHLFFTTTTTLNVEFDGKWQKIKFVVVLKSVMFAKIWSYKISHIYSVMWINLHSLAISFLFIFGPVFFGFYLFGRRALVKFTRLKKYNFEFLFF